MQIKKIDSGLLHSNMYLIEEHGHALVIDPCVNTKPAESLKVDYLLITHEHYDHISGVHEWRQITGASLLCSQICAENIKSPKKNMSKYFDVFCAMQTWMPIETIDLKPVEYSCEADMTFEDVFAFDWQGHKVTLFEVPGHSAGSIGICIDNTDFFSGDSLLESCEIELRFPGGSARMWKEIGKKRIEELPEGIKIWPGHFESFVWHRLPQSQAEERL